MLVLRLLVMVLTIICLMDGHAEVSSSTTGIRDRRESPAVKTNDSEVEILDRKKKKKPKPGKKKKTKPGKKKKPNKKKPVTTTPTVSTSTLKTTTILTTPTVTTTVTTTTTTVSPTTTATTAKITTSTASATTTLSTTTTKTTTTVATSSTASTTITTIPTTATTSSSPTTAATTADSGAGGECKATNGKPCIFPFKDGKEYNECKNEGGKYFWCATSVYDSGKYKHWSYCSTDGPCPLEGDGECRATNNKPCVFPFKDGNKEYNECADHGGKYFWCATGTNSAGKYTAWSECPKDGSCPLPPKTTTPAMTSTATAASTTPPTTGTTVATDQMEEKVLDTLESLVLGESRDDSLQLANMLDKKLDTIIKDLEGETSKIQLSNSDDIPPPSGKLKQTIKRDQDEKVRDGIELGEGLMFVLSTVDSMKSVSRLSGDCCQDCTSKYPDTELAEYWDTLDTCYCYKKMKYLDGTEVQPKTRTSSEFTTKACDTTAEDTCCETLIISSSGGTADYQGTRLGTYKKDGEHNNKPVYKQQQGSKILFFSELAGFEWVVGSSFSSGGGLRSKPGEAPACPSDAKQWEYYEPGTTNTWHVDPTARVECEEGISDCRAATKADCPTQHTFLEGGFTNVPYDGMLDSSHNVDTKCECRHLCDVRPTECKAFLFKTCSEGAEPRCILQNVVKPATTTTGLYKNHFAFCRRDRLVKKLRALQNDGTSDAVSGDKYSWDLKVYLAEVEDTPLQSPIYFKKTGDELNNFPVYKGKDDMGEIYYLFVYLEPKTQKQHWVIGDRVVNSQSIEDKHIFFVHIEPPKTKELPEQTWKQTPPEINWEQIDKWVKVTVVIIKGPEESSSCNAGAASTGSGAIPAGQGYTSSLTSFVPTYPQHVLENNWSNDLQIEIVDTDSPKKIHFKNTAHKLSNNYPVYRGSDGNYEYYLYVKNVYPSFYWVIADKVGSAATVPDIYIWYVHTNHPVYNHLPRQQIWKETPQSTSTYDWQNIRDWNTITVNIDIKIGAHGVRDCPEEKGYVPVTKYNIDGNTVHGILKTADKIEKCAMECDSDNCDAFVFINRQGNNCLLLDTMPVTSKTFSAENLKVNMCHKRGQYRCYSYNYPEENWYHRYMWHQTFRIPLFSIAKIQKRRTEPIDADDREFDFKSDDEIDPKREFNHCGQLNFNGKHIKIKKYNDKEGIPDAKEYDKTILPQLKMNRGHVLASLFYLNYIEGDEKDVQLAQKLMSNIFPQNYECNKDDGLWTEYETKTIKLAAEDCMSIDPRGLGDTHYEAVLSKAALDNFQTSNPGSRRAFYITHALIPDESRKSRLSESIQKVNYIFNSFICVNEVSDTNYQVIGWNARIFDNPDGVNDKEGNGITVKKGCTKVRDAPMAFKFYASEIKFNKNVREQLNLKNEDVHPFKEASNCIHGGVCFIGFKEEYEERFPTDVFL